MKLPEHVCLRTFSYFHAPHAFNTHVQESRYMCCHPWKEVTRSGSCVERRACARQTVCAHACGKWAVKSRHCIPSAWAWLRACSCVHARRCLHQACRPDSALHRRCMGTWSVQYSRWYALLCWDLRTRQKRVGTFMKQPG